MGVIGYLDLAGMGGDATAPGHEGDIEVYGLDWAYDPSAGAIPFTPMVIHKRMDRATPHLLQAVTTGLLVSSARMFLTRDTGRGAFDYITLEVHSPRITAFEFQKGDLGDPDGFVPERIVVEGNWLIVHWVEEASDFSLSDPARMEFRGG